MINDPFIDAQEISEELKEIEDETVSFILKFSLLSQKIRYILDQIKLCKNLKEAKDYFEILDKIHSLLSRLAYQYQIGLPDDRLNNFLHNFDRMFATQEYESYFIEIQEGKYSFK